MRSGIQLLQPLLENLSLPPRSKDAKVFHLVDRIEPLVHVTGKALHIHGDTLDDGIVIQHGVWRSLLVDLCLQYLVSSISAACFGVSRLFPRR